MHTLISRGRCCRWGPHFAAKMVGPYDYENGEEITHAQWVREWKISLAIWLAPLYIGIPILLWWWI